MRIVIVMILILVTHYCFAAEATTVHVSVGKVSEVSFPENIAKVVKGGAADSILVEAMDSALYILPKTDTPSDIFVTGVSGRSYPLNLKVSGAHDLNVVIGGGKTAAKGYQGGINVMDVMKDVLLGHEPAGATVLKIDRKITLKDDPIELRFVAAYDFPIMSVYIIKARNLSDNIAIVPTEKIMFKGLSAITSQSDTLNPTGTDGDQTTMYMIVNK